MDYFKAPFLPKMDILGLLLSSSSKNVELKCDVCSKYLSIAPILYNESLGCICGRCYEDGEMKKINNVSEYLPQVVYEMVAKHMKFPCSYDVHGCGEELDWHEVKKHEENCKYQTISCPFGFKFTATHFFQPNGGSCEWKGICSDLHGHIIMDHIEVEYGGTPGIQINPSKRLDSYFLVSSRYKVFIIMRLNMMQDTYYCNIMKDLPLVELEKYSCKLHISGNGKELIMPFDCVEKISGKVLGGGANENTLEIDIKSITKLLKDSKEIKFVFEICDGKDSDTSKFIEEPENHEGTTDMKCSNCENRLVPPVSVCKRGHNSCATCGMDRSSRRNSCRICCNYFLGRNNTVETIINLSKFPCKNQTKGCQFKTDIEHLKLHEENCHLTEKKCILNCEWEGIFPELSRHINNDHSLLYLNQTHKYDKDVNRHPILFDDKIFLLTIDFDVGCDLSLNLQCSEMQGMDYEYEFTLLNSCSNIKLVTHYLCQPLKYNKEGEIISTPMIKYPFDFFRTFISNYEEFEFKINIKKI